jgi:hypothetical protein
MMLLLIKNVSFNFGDILLSRMHIPRVSPCGGKASTIARIFGANCHALACLYQPVLIGIICLALSLSQSSFLDCGVSD